MVKILYKPLGLLFGAFGGVLAGAAFKRLRALLGHEDEAPRATDQDRGWNEVLTAAALQGAVLADGSSELSSSTAPSSRPPRSPTPRPWPPSAAANYRGLVDIGYTIPAQAWTYWHLGPGPGPDHLDDEKGHARAHTTGRTMAADLRHAASALTGRPWPAPAQ
nr:hypothetical protein KPHV_81190 [Kitasatospora purpeofusca]